MAVGVLNKPTAAVHSINSDVRDSGLSDIAADVNSWLDRTTVTRAHGMPYQPTRQEMTPERKELTLRGS
jgi:hypothetical protein